MSLAKRPAPQEYLAPGYDPSKLTINDLVVILSTHGVDLPSTRQHKQFYLDRFMHQLAPMGPKILLDIENVVPSKKGITMVSQERKRPISTDPVKRTAENEDVDTKRLKKEAPSKLPVRKSPTRPLGVSNRMRTPTKQEPQEIECPKQERFFITPELPGVRSKVEASPMFKKSVKERAHAYEQMVLADVAPAAEPDRAESVNQNASTTELKSDLQENPVSQERAGLQSEPLKKTVQQTLKKTKPVKQNSVTMWMLLFAIAGFAWMAYLTRDMSFDEIRVFCIESIENLSENAYESLTHLDDLINKFSANAAEKAFLMRDLVYLELMRNYMNFQEYIEMSRYEIETLGLARFLNRSLQSLWYDLAGVVDEIVDYLLDIYNEFDINDIKPLAKSLFSELLRSFVVVGQTIQKVATHYVQQVVVFVELMIPALQKLVTEIVDFPYQQVFPVEIVILQVWMPAMVILIGGLILAA
ncbi:hypothetical protein EDD86DRAFT_196448 [Gorgonomyces haynaldii]|nr:hypothetical protein EDD86DRAFT_196448 [Gorgonomyces haynaldii]